jgi:hypothetical protein
VLSCSFVPLSTSVLSSRSIRDEPSKGDPQACCFVVTSPLVLLLLLLTPPETVSSRQGRCR